jgi:uncharacterized protein (TIGR02145 family)
MNKITTAIFSSFIMICYGQTNWSIEDLNVTTFRNGDALLEVNSLQDLKFCSDNQQPAYYRNTNSMNNGVLYNFYAVNDPRGLAPKGYEIASREDLRKLDDTVYYQAPSSSWKTRCKSRGFYAEANGYIDSDNFEVLSKGMAGYYWTNSIGEALKSVIYVFTDNESGFAISELPRESFCSVRCVAKENEQKDFEKNESLLRQNKKYSEYIKIVSLDEQINTLKETGSLLESERRQIVEYLKNIDSQIRENDSKRNNLENELQKIVNPGFKATTTGETASNPFGTGGDGGGKGSGSGTGFGNGGGSSIGPGSGGNGSSEGRRRLNNPSVDHIKTAVNVTIYLKMTINEAGEVVKATNLASKTTTTDQRIINQVISAVIN